MILAACLLLVSSTMMLAGPRLVLRLTRSRQRPLVGLVAWQLASWSILVGVLSAAALIAAPSLLAGGQLPGGLESCLAAIGHLDHPADNAFLQTVAVVLAVGVVSRLVGCTAQSAWVNHQRRTRHRMLLGVVGHRDADLGAYVVDDDTPVVYCLPGRGGRVVFTSAALRRLTPAQRAAVLTHERAHLRGRHHLLLASATLLARAFPRVRLFAEARDQTAQLIELRADDVAVRSHDRRRVAEALLRLADAGSPTYVLAAASVATTARVERLLRPPVTERSSAISTVGRYLGYVAVAGLAVTSPLLLAVAGHAVLCLA